MSEVKLKIRHAKRGNEKTIDLSNMGLTEIPADLVQLAFVETVIVSNNKLTNLRRIESLSNLREVIAINNNISQLHPELGDIYGLETIVLMGNPIVNANPQLAKIEKNEELVSQALDQYFNGGGGNSTAMPPQAIASRTLASGSGAIGSQSSSYLTGSNLAGGSGGTAPNQKMMVGAASSNAYGYSMTGGQGGTVNISSML